MWVCLNNSFLSIVDPDAGRKTNGDLLVRARRKGDIERVFPGAKVKRTAGRDYLYRATLKRDAVAAAISASVVGINYDNFKSSVVNDKLHSVYSRVWGVILGLQATRPYSGGRSRSLFDEVDR